MATAPAQSDAPEAPAAPSYDPVALAESLASAAEKSAKLMGDFASRQAEAGSRSSPTNWASPRPSWT